MVNKNSEEIKVLKEDMALSKDLLEENVTEIVNRKFKDIVPQDDLRNLESEIRRVSTNLI